MPSAQPSARSESKTAEGASGSPRLAVGPAAAADGRHFDGKDDDGDDDGSHRHTDVVESKVADTSSVATTAPPRPVHADGHDVTHGKGGDAATSSTAATSAAATAVAHGAAAATAATATPATSVATGASVPATTVQPIAASAAAAASVSSPQPSPTAADIAPAESLTPRAPSMTSLSTDELVAWYFQHRDEMLACFEKASKDGKRASIDSLYDAWGFLGMKHRCAQCGRALCAVHTS